MRRWNQHSGDFGKPVWHVLEGQFEMLLANAEQSKKSPTRERRQLHHLDGRSAGRELIRLSFVRWTDPGTAPPDADAQAAGAGGVTLKLRIQKVLEDANVKVASGASDMLGASSGGWCGRAQGLPVFERSVSVRIASGPRD